MLHNTSLNTRGHATAETIRINDFVVREDAETRDDQSVRALEEALAQRENALSEAPVTL
jgi:DNA-binding protein YbaB